MTENSFKQNYIDILFRKWWLIVMITGSISVIALLIVLNQPNLYQAQSKLLIVVPVGSRVVSTEEGSPEVSFPSLSVETLTALARGGDLLFDIINDLNLKDEATGNPLSVESLEAMMEASYESTGVGSQYVRIPILKMTIEGENPKQLKDIADSWAFNFEKKNAALFTSETAKSYTFLDSQYTEAKNIYDSLLDTQTIYKKKNPIALLTEILESSQKKFREINETLSDKTNELSLTKIELNAVNAEIVDRSYKNEWIGFAIDLSVSNSKISELGLLDLKARDTFFNTQKFLNIFMNSNNVTQKESFLLQLQTQILQNNQRLLVAEKELTVASARKKELNNELSKQDQLILIVKSVDDPTLRQQLGLDPNAATWNQIRDLGITTEVINEVYVSISNELSAINVEISGLTNEVTFLKAKLLVDRESGLKLELELSDILLIQLPKLEQRLVSAQAAYDIELLRYNSTIQRQKDLKYRVIDLNAEVEALSNSYKIGRTLLEDDESNLLTAEIFIGQLEKEIITIGSSFDTLSIARQAAKIAKSEQEGSIRLVEGAIEPQVPVGPARRATLIMTGVVSLMLSVCVAFLFQYIQDSGVFARRRNR